MLVDWSDVAETAVIRYGAQQDADELAVLLAILDQLVQPATILEIGAGTGGSSWAWAQLPSVERIITVDKDLTWAPGRLAYQSIHVVGIQGVSSDTQTRVRVTGELAPHDADVVYIDAAHDYRSARMDWDLYGPLVAKDGVVVFHDSQGYPGRDDFGVGQLVGEIRKDRPVLELFSRPGGPAGTAIVWADATAHGLTYNEREAWRR